MPHDASVLGRRAYLASVAFVDEQVGKIYGALQRTGLLQTTFLIWTSDHGDGQGDHCGVRCIRTAACFSHSAATPASQLYPRLLSPIASARRR